jgi:hypothetical protein
MQLDLHLPLRWQLDVAGWQQTVDVLVPLPVRVLRTLLAKFEQRSKALTSPWVDRPAQRSIYKMTNRAMQPLLRHFGYRSLKQFDAAYAELGKNTPFPRRRAPS